MKILIVEDNEGDQMLLKEAFKQAESSAQLVFAENPDKAMAVLKDDRASAKPDHIKLILLDLNLPKKSGKDLLKELKSDHALSQIPVLVLTSSHAESDISECYSQGASCYLTKPLTFDRLQELVDSFCKFWLKEVTFAD